MSIVRLGGIAVGYSKAMDSITAQLRDPDLVNDPARLAIFNMQLDLAKNGYTFTARAIQDLTNEDKILAEMLREA